MYISDLRDLQGAYNEERARILIHAESNKTLDFIEMLNQIRILVVKGLQ